MAATLQRDGGKDWRGIEREEVEGNRSSRKLSKDGGIYDENGTKENGN